MFKALKEPYWRLMIRNAIGSFLAAPLAVLYLIALASFTPAQLRALLISLAWIPMSALVISCIQHWLFLRPMIKATKLLAAGAPVSEEDRKKAESRALLFPYVDGLFGAIWFCVAGILIVLILRLQTGVSEQDAAIINASARSAGVLLAVVLFYISRPPLRDALATILTDWKDAPRKPRIFVPLAVKLSVSLVLVIGIVVTFLGLLSFVTTKGAVEAERDDNQASELNTLSSLMEKAAPQNIELAKSLLSSAAGADKAICLSNDNNEEMFCAGNRPSAETLASLAATDALSSVKDSATGWAWKLRKMPGRGRILSGWAPSLRSDIKKMLTSAYFWVGIVVLLVGIIVGIIIALDIARTLKDLSDVAVRVSQGEQITRIIPGGEDETGILGRAFGEMTGTLLSKLRGELDRGRAMMTSIRDAVDALAPMSQEMVVISAQQASGSMKQASSAEEAASTSEEIATVSKQIAGNSNMVSTTAEGSLELTRNGQERLEHTRKAFDDINQKMKLIADAVAKLSDQSREIGGIVRIIDDISDQTTLLAFNAAIEAAGAGEHGRRFGVVAQQIQRLARNTVHSTKQIRDIVTRMQTSLGSSVVAAEEGDKAVGRGKGSIEEMTKLLGAVFQAATAATHQMKEIGLMTSQQATASDQMAKTMAEVRETAIQSSTSAEELTASVAELEKIIVQLQAHLESEDANSPET